MIGRLRSNVASVSTQPDAKVCICEYVKEKGKWPITEMLAILGIKSSASTFGQVAGILNVRMPDFLKV